MADRRFDDKEVGEILKRAAEMQSGLPQSGKQEGMSLAELQKVAEEVGISPDMIQRAARDLDVVPTSKSRNKSNSILLEKQIDHEISEETWDEIVTELRRTTGKAGKFELVGSTREWTGSSDTESMTVSAKNINGQARLKILGDTTGTVSLISAFGLAFGILFTLVPEMVAAKNHGSMSPFLVAILSVLVAGLCIATTVGGIWASRKKLELQVEEILANLTDVIEDRRAMSQEPMGDQLNRTQLRASVQVPMDSERNLLEQESRVR